MTPHPPHLALVPPAAAAPIGRDAGGVPLVDLLRSGLIRVNASGGDDAGERPAAAA